MKNSSTEHLQIQLQDCFRFTFSWHFSSISFFTFPDAPYRIFLLFLPWLSCHFYLVVIEQQKQMYIDLSYKYFHDLFGIFFHLFLCSVAPLQKLVSIIISLGTSRQILFSQITCMLSILYICVHTHVITYKCIHLHTYKYDDRNFPTLCSPTVFSSPGTFPP